MALTCAAIRFEQARRHSLSTVPKDTIMNRILRTYAAIFISFLLITATNSALAIEGAPVMTRIQQSGQLVLGTAGTMPPMTEKMKDGKVVGLDLDLAKLIAETMKVKLVIKVLPFEKLIPALEQGQVDMVISNMTINPNRNMRVAFVGPYIISGKCLITKQQKLAKADEAEELNIADASFAVLKGSTSEDFARMLLSKANIVAVKDYATGIKMVADNKVSAMLTEFPICMSATKKHADKGFVSIFSTLTYEPIGIALPSNDPLLINWTENFLERIDQVGLMELLVNKWLIETKMNKSVQQ